MPAKAIIRHALGIIILTAIYIVFYFVEKQKSEAEKTMDKNHFVVHYAKLPIWVTGFFAFLLAVAVLIEAIFIREVELVLFLITFLFALLFSSAFTYYVHWELSIV